KTLEASISKLAEDMDSIKKEYDEIKVKTQKAQKQYKDYSAKFNDLKETRKEETEKIMAELAAIKKEVDPEIFSKYEAKRKDKMFPIVFEANIQEGKNGTSGRCGCCGMALSMKDMSDLSQGELVECDNCRALVYKK
ncbi:MAG: hypothetical protein MJ072_02595, partial [Clostridia bacterium]|nr:hypothetical protein [Clostridia bacterium]